jgi:hypothetical protein
MQQTNVNPRGYIAEIQCSLGVQGGTPYNVPSGCSGVLVVEIHRPLDIVRQITIDFLPRINVGLDCLSDGVSLCLNVGDHVAFVALLTKQRRRSREVFSVGLVSVPAPHGRGVHLRYPALDTECTGVSSFTVARSGPP